jgi:hypothetical protein
VTPEQWQRAKLVLEGARRHGPADRSQYVSLACADDPELLQEVESLLNLDVTPPGTPVADSGTFPRTTWEHLTLLAEVGRGAFGRVYRAWDPALQVEVALKLLKVDPREPTFAETVFHEARLLVKVRHPNVVTVLGAKHAGNEVGIWMEFVNGPTLADAVERDGPMDAPAAAAAGAAVCDALAAVHGAGMFHRDIKARNIMRDAAGRVVLMDFGAGAERTRAPHGEMAGTPLYMAPELLKGAGASAASDIYSVGVVLFHLVTGEYPVTGTSLYELEAAHERGIRTRLSERRPDLPAVFVHAVDRALSPEPSERFRRAVEFKQALLDPSISTHVARRPSAPPSRLTTAITWLLGSVFGVGFLGFFSTATFNFVFGRSGFGAEPVSRWFEMGLRSLFAPVLYIGIILIATLLVTGTWRGLLRLIPVLRRAAARGRLRWRTFVTRFGLGDPILLMRMFVASGALALGLFVFTFWDFIDAYMSFITSAAVEELARLSPENSAEHVSYGRWLDVLILAGLAGTISIRRAAVRRAVRIPRGLTGVAFAIPVVAILLWEMPYRILFWSEFPRVDLGDAQCYQIGDNASNVLLHCPDLAPPRNRIVPAADPRLQPRPLVQSVFISPSAPTGEAVEEEIR